MKNKEIEELLNKIRNSIKTHKKLNLDDDMLVVLEFDVIQWNLLLSYIEQLENNRDKAIEYFKFENPEIFKNPKYTNHLWTIDGLTIKRFIDKLKGDSDGNIR